jgi:prepilin-type N-terminal cleavage/methylation domain-containing protein
MVLKSRRGDPRAKRRGFTLVELLVVITIIGMLMAMMFPALGTVMDAVNLNRCMNNLSSLGKGIAGFQSAASNAWPTVSTQPVNSKPGWVVATRTSRSGKPDPKALKSAGYSWLVMMLPYMDQNTMFKSLNNVNAGFTKSAFEPGLVDDNNRHFATVSHKWLQCPVFESPGEIPYTSDAPEYNRFAASAGDGSGKVALTNYVALSATHLRLVLPPPKETAAPNGVIYYSPQGRGPTNIPDGASNTVVIAETREPNYASWFDGTTSWAVAHAPGSKEPTKDGNRYKCEPADGCRNALGLDPSQKVAEGQQVEYYRETWAGEKPWAFGPSSSHAGGPVVHMYGDKRVVSLQSAGPLQISSTVYLAIVSRGGGEPDRAPE